MAVNDLTFPLEDHESATVVSNNTRYGSGPGASSGSTDNFIEGLACTSRRVSNATNKGLGVSVTSTNLVGQHFITWVLHSQFSLLTALQIVVASGTGANDFDAHQIGADDIPATGGWIPVWVNVDRVGEIAGSSFAPGSVNEIGARCTLPSAGGSVDNFFVDSQRYGTSGAGWDGTGGSFSDFRTWENTNNYGVFRTRDGIDFCYARLEIGSATATTFTDSGYTLVFPDQPLVASDFMGLTVDLQNASTSITLSGNMQSSAPVTATNRPDLIVTGTSGAFDISSKVFSGLRIINLTSSVTSNNSNFTNCGVISTNGCILSGANINSSILTADEGAINTSTLGDISACNFTRGTAGHAVRLTAAGDYSWNSTLSGYEAGISGNGLTGTAADAAIYVDVASGTININVAGGTTPSIRRAAGSTATINVTADFTLTLTNIPNNARYTIVNSSTRTILQDGISTGTDITYTHGGGETVDILIIDDLIDPNLSDVLDRTLPSANSEIAFRTFDDINFSNPT